MTAKHLSSSPRVQLRQRIATETLAGVGGLIFLALVIFQNLIKLATNPAANATPAQILRYAQDQAWIVDLLVVTYVIGYPALLLFTSGLVDAVQRENPEAAFWGRVGQSSVVVIMVLFGFVNIMQVALVAAQRTLAANQPLTTLLWTLHNAIFTLNFVAVGGSLLGLGWAATLGGLVPRRLGFACVAGAALLVVAAAPMVDEVHGSPALGIGLLGFLCWLLFLAVASLRLLHVGARGHRAN